MATDNLTAVLHGIEDLRLVIFCHKLAIFPSFKVILQVFHNILPSVRDARTLGTTPNPNDS